MEWSKSFLSSSLLGVLLTVSATVTLADGVTASAVLGGTPFAIINYGPNIVKGRAVLVSESRVEAQK